MGIRFDCHLCGKPLNIKADLAGRRGVCPSCRGRFRIPTDDAPASLPLDMPAVTDVAPAANDTSGDGLDAGGMDIGESDSPNPGDSSFSVMDSLLESDSPATWYVRPPAGGQYGPADRATLQDWIKQGRVAPEALLWRDGWPQWRSAAEALPELAGQLASAKSPEMVAPTAPSPRPGMTAPNLSGDAAIGTTKAKASQQRLLVIGGLAALLLGLIAILVFLVVR